MACVCRRTEADASKNSQGCAQAYEWVFGIDLRALARPDRTGQAAESKIAQGRKKDDECRRIRSVSDVVAACRRRAQAQGRSYARSASRESHHARVFASFFWTVACARSVSEASQHKDSDALAPSLARLLGVVFRVLATPRRHGEAPQSQGSQGDEKADELLPLLFDQGSDLLLSVLPAVFSGDKAQDGKGCVMQDDTAATHAAKMSKEEGELWFTENAIYSHNKVRAFAGWPGTTAQLVINAHEEDEEKIKVKIISTRIRRKEGGATLGVHQISCDQKANSLVSRVLCGFKK